MKTPAVAVVALALSGLLIGCSTAETEAAPDPVLSSSTTVATTTAPVTATPPAPGTTSPPPAATTSTSAAPPTPSTTTPTASPTTVPHTPRWLTVESRSDRVDVAHPRFLHVERGTSSTVNAAHFDPDNEYLIVEVEGTGIHYCGMPMGLWAKLTTADPLGKFHDLHIKGRFDCTAGAVPAY